MNYDELGDKLRALDAELTFEHNGNVIIVRRTRYPSITGVYDRMGERILSFRSGMPQTSDDALAMICNRLTDCISASGDAGSRWDKRKLELLLAFFEGNRPLSDWYNFGRMI